MLRGLFIVTLGFASIVFSTNVFSESIEENRYCNILLDNNDTSVEYIVSSIEETKGVNNIKLGILTKLDNGEFQSDILDYLRIHFPLKTQQVLRSTGNINNPKMLALREPFIEAVLNSGFVLKVNKRLSKKSYIVSGAEIEKLFHMTCNNKLSFEAFVWLVIKKQDN